MVFDTDDSLQSSDGNRTTETTTVSRRCALQAGLVTAVSLAGCLDTDSSDPNGESDTESESSSDGDGSEGEGSDSDEGYVTVTKFGSKQQQSTSKRDANPNP